jgi:hypothetical protein
MNKFVLLFKTGKTLVVSVRAVAELYVTAYDCQILNNLELSAGELKFTVAETVGN